MSERAESWAARVRHQQGNGVLALLQHHQRTEDGVSGCGGDTERCWLHQQLSPSPVVSLRTVGLGNGPVDWQVVRDLKDERSGVRREVLIHRRHHQSRSFGSGALTHKTTDRDHLRGKVIGFLQGDGHRTRGGQAFGIYAGENNAVC